MPDVANNFAGPEQLLQAQVSDADIPSTYYVVPNSCAVRNNSVGWKIHPN